MTVDQREQDPDVNSYNPDAEPSEEPGATDDNNDSSTDVERGPGTDGIPVPPDVEPSAPVEEPPDTDGVPVGDVDDSPKRIV